eukprot:273302-Pyramimonas_sp.AAC.1
MERAPIARGKKGSAPGVGLRCFGGGEVGLNLPWADWGQCGGLRGALRSLRSALAPLPRRRVSRHPAEGSQGVGATCLAYDLQALQVVRHVVVLWRGTIQEVKGIISSQGRGGF